MDQIIDQQAIARECEERLINVWPAVTTLIMEGWAIRFANGYSARANSASAIQSGAVMTPQLIGESERLFAREGLAPTVRVTPVAAQNTEAFLISKGYTVKDEAITMVRRLPFATAGDARVQISPLADDEWLHGISIRQQASKRSPEHLAVIVNKIKLPVAFATLRLGGEALGFGLAAIDRGWAELGSIMIDAGRRGQGLGHGLVSSMLEWATGQGATQAFLQVDVENTPAINLYQRLGFSPAYRYKTMVKMQPAG